jgi:hypothetical protein
MFLSWREGFADFRREDRCPKFWSGGCFLGQWFKVELLFLDFLCQLNAADRHGRRLESLESEHRPDPLLYSPVILLDNVGDIPTKVRKTPRDLAQPPFIQRDMAFRGSQNQIAFRPLILGA